MKRFTHVGLGQKLGTSWNRMEFSFLINQPLCLVRKSSDPKLNPLWPKWALPEPFCCSRIFQGLGGSHVFFDVSNPNTVKSHFLALQDSFLVISNPNLAQKLVLLWLKNPLRSWHDFQDWSKNTPATFRLRNWVNKESNNQPLPESGYHLEIGWSSSEIFVYTHKVTSLNGQNEVLNQWNRTERPPKISGAQHLRPFLVVHRRSHRSPTDEAFIARLKFFSQGRQHKALSNT